MMLAFLQRWAWLKAPEKPAYLHGLKPGSLRRVFLSAVLTEAFGRLPKSLQDVHLVRLGLLATSIVFLMAPAAFHHIVERGEDTQRLHRFSSAMVLAALVPLALGIAGDFYVVADKVLDTPTFSLALAIASLIFFYGVWFGLTLVVRARSGSSGHEPGAGTAGRRRIGTS